MVFYYDLCGVLMYMLASSVEGYIWCRWHWEPSAADVPARLMPCHPPCLHGEGVMLQDVPVLGRLTGAVQEAWRSVFLRSVLLPKLQLHLPCSRAGAVRGKGASRSWARQENFPPSRLTACAWFVTAYAMQSWRKGVCVCVSVSGESWHEPQHPNVAVVLQSPPDSSRSSLPAPASYSFTAQMFLFVWRR